MILLRARLIELLHDKRRGHFKTDTLSLNDDWASLIDIPNTQVDLGKPTHLHSLLRRENPTSGDINDTLRQANNLVSIFWEDEIAEQLGKVPEVKHADAKLRPLFVDELGVFSFAAAIGMDAARVRYLIDRNYQLFRPSINALALSQDDSDQFMNDHSGLYYLYRHEPFSPSDSLLHQRDVITRGVVSVRYPIPYSIPVSGESKKPYAHRGTNERIRVKLVMPLYPDNDPTKTKLSLAKYDGFVAPTRANDKFLLWLLELREGNDQLSSDGVLNDFCTMYSTSIESLPDGPSHPAIEGLVGCMLTQSQDRKRTPVYSPVFMRKLPEFEVRERGFDRRPTKGPSFGEIYDGGYYSLFDRTRQEHVNERVFTREQAGFIVDQDYLLPVDKVKVELVEADRAAIAALQSNDTRSFGSVR